MGMKGAAMARRDEQKRAQIQEMITAYPEMSNYAIAKALGSNTHLVNVVRLGYDPRYSEPQAVASPEYEGTDPSWVVWVECIGLAGLGGLLVWLVIDSVRSQRAMAPSDIAPMPS